MTNAFALIVGRELRLALRQAQETEADLFGSMAATEDTREGLAAFLEKRAATWKGC